MKKFEDRQVRIFISSTFRDMQAEREVLVKHVFPRLRQKCRERAVELTEIDLRWGLDEEQSQTLQASADSCLKEIDLCKGHPPFFISFLGERYGAETTAKECQELYENNPQDDWAWLKNYPNASITELEIVHAIFSRLETNSVNFEELAKNTLFYQRDSAYINNLPPEEELENFVSANELAKQKQIALKKRIIDEGFEVNNYQKPADLSNLILRQLWHAINQRFPLKDKPTVLEQQGYEHEAFAESRTHIYIQRPADFKRLDEHAASADNKPLVILGESGSGKSALLANWALRYRQSQPKDVVMFYFIGSSPKTSDYVEMLHYLMAQLKQHYHITEEVPNDPEALVEKLPWFLASVQGRLILILDGLNQLSSDTTKPLAWLPEYIPSQIRLFLSTLEGPTLEALKQRQWETFTVKLLSSVERESLIVDYLKHFRKSLNQEQIKAIASSEQTHNPLYLRVLLEELRIFGSYDELNTEIEHYLGAKNPIELYEKVLSRLESDYERERPQLVKDAFSLLWVSRRGLTQHELLEILEIPQAIWTPLFLAVQDALVNREGKLNFFHDYLRQAIKNCYLPSVKEQKLWHLRLADYFDKQQISERVSDELPWHLKLAGEKERLRNCISEIPMFLQLGRFNKVFELWSYWLVLNPDKMVGAYNESLAGYKEREKPKEEDLGYILNLLGAFFLIMGYFLEATLLLRQALAIREIVFGKQNYNTAESMAFLGMSYFAKDNYDSAQLLLKRALEISEEVLGKKHPKTAQLMALLPLAYQRKGNYDLAKLLFKRALEISEEVFGKKHPETASIMINLASCLVENYLYLLKKPFFKVIKESFSKKMSFDVKKKYFGNRSLDTFSISEFVLLSYPEAKGDIDSAKLLVKRALEINKKFFGKQQNIYTLNAMAVWSLFVDLESAKTILKNILAIDKKFFGKQHFIFKIKRSYLFKIRLLKLMLKLIKLLIYVLMLPLIFYYLFNLVRNKLATNLLKAKYIFEKLLGKENLNTATYLDNLANSHYAKGNYDSAQLLLRRALVIREKLDAEHPDTATSLNNLAMLLKAKGDYDSAILLHRRALAIREKVLGAEHPATASSLDNLATLLRLKIDYDGAEPLFRRALVIREKLGAEHPDTATALNNLAILLKLKGDYDAAVPLQRRALAIREKVLGAEHPATASSLDNLATLLRLKVDYDGAEPLFRRALVIREKLGAEHLDTATALNNLAILLKLKGDYDAAVPLQRRALAIREKVLGAEHPATASSMGNLATLLRLKGDYKSAELLQRRALAIREKVGIEHLGTATSLNNLAILLKLKGDYDSAEPLFRRALTIFEKVSGTEHLSTATTLYGLAELLRAKGDYDDSEPLFRRALSIYEKVSGAEHPDTAYPLNNLSLLLYNKGDYDSAEPLFRRALAIREKVLGAEHPATAISLNDFAGLLRAKGISDQAEQLYRRALAIRKKVLGAEHPDTVKTRDNLERCLAKMDEKLATTIIPETEGSRMRKRLATTIPETEGSRRRGRVVSGEPSKLK